MDMDLDINALRVGVTLASFLIFGGIVRWALLARNKPAFDEAQQLPFIETGAPE
jgi:cytochrome c oxidase cbb3-type subunit 4